MAITAQFIENNILTQYGNKNNFKHASKRTYIYNNENILVPDTFKSKTLNSNVIILNGELNWNCYYDINGYAEDCVFVIDDGTTILYHGHEAALPFSIFDITLHKFPNNKYYDIYHYGYAVALFIVPNPTVNDLPDVGIYDDSIERDHLAGWNKLTTNYITSITNAEDESSYVVVEFDNNVVNSSNVDVYVQDYIDNILKPNKNCFY